MMDKQILDAFATEMLELLQTGSEFMGEQAPMVCQELLRYHLATSLLGVAVGMTLFGVGRWAFKKLSPIDGEAAYVLTGIIWVVAGIIGLINMMIMLKIIIAPRVFLIDYFTELVAR